MKIYLTRHGETEWNKMGKLQGWKNSNLTEKGIEDANNLKDLISDVPFDLVYTSDLGRAVSTTEILTSDRDNPKIVITERLRELSLGIWEGMTYDDTKLNYPNEYHDYIYNPQLYKPEIGEDYSDLMSRVNSVLDEIINSDAENVLIVTHGVTLMAIINAINNTPIENFWNEDVVHGASLTIINYNNNVFEIEVYAYREHIR
ncbi:MAG: histidine phosphatase family protein [Tissierellia bacterium]|nr:histidine phosphatase family protein [Tissierellia bacterium]